MGTPHRWQSHRGVVGVWMKAFAGDTAGVPSKIKKKRASIDVTLNVKLNCAVAPERVYVMNTGKFSLKISDAAVCQDNSDLDLQSLRRSKQEDLSFDPVNQ